jgi:hypothetical protein
MWRRNRSSIVDLRPQTVQPPDQPAPRPLDAPIRARRPVTRRRCQIGSAGGGSGAIPAGTASGRRIASARPA